MKATSSLIACGLVLFSSMLMSASTGDRAPAAPHPRAGIEPVGQEPQCGGEPCIAVARGFLAFFDRRLEGLGGNGRACADCHMATDHFQLSPADVEARFQVLQFRRRWYPGADDPLFRPIDADDFRTDGDNASDFSNLRQNGLVRITFTLPSNMKLIDPATNAPSAETFVDVWRAVPTVNDVALTGPDDVNPWPRGPNQFGGYQLDARVTTLQEQALGALTNHAQVQQAPPTRLLDDLASFQRVLFTNHRVRALADAVRESTPLPDPDPPLNELEQQGKVVFVRACSQCHGGPSQSNGQAPVIRFHDISTQCPRPVDAVAPARWLFAACAPQLAQTRTHADHDGQRQQDSPHERIGRALLTGFVGGVPGAGRLEQIRRAQAARHQQDRAVFPQQQRGHPRRRGRSLYGVFQARQANLAPVAPPIASTMDGVHFDRRRHRKSARRCSRSCGSC